MSRSEKIIWLCFAATSAQLAFLQPYLILVPGERTNLFSGLLCLLTLLVAVIFGRKDAIKVKSPELLVSAALLGLAAISGLLNGFPASCRVFVLLASGLGGFWCARLLLNTPASQRLFAWLGLGLLAGVILLSLTGYYVSGHIQYFLPAHGHAITNIIILLSFAPLALLYRQTRLLTALGIALLCAGYAVLCLSERLSVVLIPIGLCAVLVLFGTLRLKYLVLVLIPVISMAAYFSHQILWWKLSSKEHLSYRIENYPFSLSIARQHPLFGIGLATPRDSFLKDYQIKYPYVPEELFTKNIHKLVTPDNIFLTFISGLGFPFAIIYGAALIVIFSRLIRLTFRPPPGLFLPPLALFLPLAMALAHFQIYDGLLYPQSSWFFHVLLGLIPLHAPSLKESEPVSAGPV
jgi:hypothetical protein